VPPIARARSEPKPELSPSGGARRGHATTSARGTDGAGQLAPTPSSRGPGAHASGPCVAARAAAMPRARGPWRRPDPRRRGGIRRPGRNGSLARAQPGAPRSGGQVAAISGSAHKLWCPGRMGAGCCASCLSEIISFAERRSGRRVGAGALGYEHGASACTRHASISIASRRFLVLLFGFPPSSLSIRRVGPVGSECM